MNHTKITHYPTCTIKQEIRKKQNGVPVGNTYYYMPYPVEYMLFDDIDVYVFVVCINGEWKSANPYDWEFT